MRAVFADATEVTASIAFEDSQGNAVVPTAASFRVLDEEGVELVAATAASIAADPVVVVVPAAQNTLAADTPRGYRVVEMSFITVAGTIVTTSGYMVEKAQVLEVMTNSYQTFGRAEIAAAAMPDLERWNLKTDRERKMALIQAYHRLGTLTYQITDKVTDQSSIDFGRNQRVLQINRLTKAQFDLLLVPFRDAIRRAQVAEADTILGGDSIVNLRREGIMSESVGESTQFFRATRPITLPISSRALRELQGFIRFGATITRS